MKTTLQETSAEVIGLPARKHQERFDEADREIKELLQKKRSCHDRLLAKPDAQSAKAAYKTASGKLQAKLGPRRMVGGQHSLRGRIAMLTWETCAPSMRH